jgi:hypothetical protein
VLSPPPLPLVLFTVVDLFSHPLTRVRMGREVSGVFTALKWLGSLMAEINVASDDL